MTQPDVTSFPSGEAFAFVGIAAQALAIVWIWRDWQMSQYQQADWRKKHRQSEGQTLKSLRILWSKFGGPATAGEIDWDNLGSDQLEDIGKEFPAHGNDDVLRKRKVDALTTRYGIGPSDDELKNIRKHLELLAIIRRGVADYRTFIRKQTFQTALQLMLLGFVLQLIGSWPSKWLVQIEAQNIQGVSPQK